MYLYFITGGVDPGIRFHDELFRRLSASAGTQLILRLLSANIRNAARLVQIGAVPDFRDRPLASIRDAMYRRGSLRSLLVEAGLTMLRRRIVVDALAYRMPASAEDALLRREYEKLQAATLTKRAPLSQLKSIACNLRVTFTNEYRHMVGSTGERKMCAVCSGLCRNVCTTCNLNLHVVPMNSASRSCFEYWHSPADPLVSTPARQSAERKVAARTAVAITLDERLDDGDELPVGVATPLGVAQAAAAAAADAAVDDAVAAAAVILELAAPEAPALPGAAPVAPGEGAPPPPPPPDVQTPQVRGPRKRPAPGGARGRSPRR